MDPRAFERMDGNEVSISAFSRFSDKGVYSEL